MHRFSCRANSFKDMFNVLFAHLRKCRSCIDYINHDMPELDACADDIS